MTIKDIARLSGYGVGTVSRVINNHPDVSDKARKAIEKVIKEYDFQPNKNAALLKGQKSSPILIVVKGRHNILFADLLEQIMMHLKENDEEANVNYLDEDDNEVKYASLFCRDMRPKGIIFLGGNMEYFENDFSEIQVPCLLLTNSAEYLDYMNLSSLTTDDEGAASDVIEYLISKGHTNIGILGGNLSASQISYQRLQGCMNTMKKHHLEFDLIKQFEPCRYSMEEGYDAAKRLLRKNPSLTAIFSLGDMIAIGAMRAICDMGKNIPEDISIVGYDGTALTRYCCPRLVTVQQDTDTMARKGVELLLQRMHYNYPAVHKIIVHRLLEGESVEIHK